MDFQTRYKFDPKTDLLGRGGFSKVYKATDTLLERTVALKFFTGSAADKYQILNEIKKVIRFEHSNLCKYYDVAVLANKNVLGETERIEVGIMEYIDAGNFKTYTRKNPEYIDELLIDVLRGLAYLHKHGIAHRDLKPQNILIKMVDGEPVGKITDFGISKLIDSDDNNSSTLLGTIEYMAPEQFNPKKYGINGRITTNLDLWSFGSLVYEALCHRSFFGSRSSGISAEQVMSNILNEASLEKADALPAKYREIIKRCLVRNASERVKNALELIPLFNDKFIPAGKIQNNQESVSNKIDKINAQETRVIEPETLVTETPKVIDQSVGSTSEVTQVVASTGGATTDEREVTKPEAETATGETKVVQSVSGTTDQSQFINHFPKTESDVTQVMEFGQEVNTNETQSFGRGADNSTGDTTDQTQVFELVAETTSDVTEVIDSSKETQTPEPISENPTEDTTVETQVIEDTLDVTADKTQAKIDAYIPQTTKEETRSIDSHPGDTEVITPVIMPVDELTEDQTQLIDNNLAKQILNKDTAVNKETVDKPLSGEGKVIRKDNLSGIPSKRAVVFSGVAILLILLFVAYALYNSKNPAGTVASNNQKTPPASDTGLENKSTEKAEAKINETNINREIEPSSLNETENVGSKSVKSPKTEFYVLFNASEDCWIKINGKDHGKIIKGKPKQIKLPIGNYKLSFKSAETRQTLDSSFHVISDIEKAGPYVYTVSFKKSPVVTTGKQSSEDTVQKNNTRSVTPTVNSERNARNSDSISRASSEIKSPAAPSTESVIVSRLGADMILVSGGKSTINFGKREVKQDEWQAIMGYNHSNNICNDCPVENVSWAEVNSFIDKINKISNKRFRLPTKAEWEFVARERIKTAVEGSGPPSDKKIEELLQQTSWYNKNAEGKTHPVARKNALGGIYDLLGNVAEWCSEKVVKGGSFKDEKDDLKPLLTTKENASTQKGNIGFRLVMEAN